MFYLMIHSTHFIYDYMASDIGNGPLSKRKPAAAATTWATLSN